MGLGLRPDPKRVVRKSKPRAPRREAETEAFKRIVCAARCLLADSPGHVCEAPLQAAHVVSKQTLRRRGLLELLWSPENGVPLCYRAHRRHDLAVERIPRSLLPTRCIEWAIRHGVYDALCRHWPSTEESQAA